MARRAGRAPAGTSSRARLARAKTIRPSLEVALMAAPSLAVGAGRPHNSLCTARMAGPHPQGHFKIDWVLRCGEGTHKALPHLQPHCRLAGSLQESATASPDQGASAASPLPLPARLRSRDDCHICEARGKAGQLQGAALKPSRELEEGAAPFRPRAVCRLPLCGALHAPAALHGGGGARQSMALQPLPTAFCQRLEVMQGAKLRGRPCSTREAGRKGTCALTAGQTGSRAPACVLFGVR